MVVEWLAALAAAGGSALVGAAANEAWVQARAGAVALFAKVGRRREIVERWADETAAEIEATPVAARDEARQRLAPQWAGRWADLLEEFPELEAELRAWSDEVRRELPPASQTWVQTFIAQGNATQYNAPHGSITVQHVREEGPGVP
jgi:hypothetical protein